MIACAQCKTTNTLDSLFCRRCGIELPPEALTEARAELARLVGVGTVAFEEGRIDEAMAIAEEASVTDPSSANAFALKGMIHERRGEVAKALECYERVVDLNPDSALDRIKLSGLRAALAERATTAPDRRVPVLAGLSAAILLGCVGIGVAKMVEGSRTTPIATTTLSPETTPRDGLLASATPTLPTQAPAASPANLAPDDVRPVQNTSETSNTIPTPSNGELPRARNDRGNSSNRPSNMVGSLPPMGISPALPEGSIGRGLPSPDGTRSLPTQPEPRNPVSRNIDPTPGAVETPRNTAPQIASTRAPKGDGTIMVSMGRGSGNSSDASSGGVEPTGNGAEALLRVGNAHLQSGEYAKAASAYEKARGAGADSGSVNQKLGQAYERLGKKSEAISAYSRAERSFQERLNGGKSDERAANGLNSVQQAQKVLGRG